MKTRKDAISRVDEMIAAIEKGKIEYVLPIQMLHNMQKVIHRHSKGKEVPGWETLIKILEDGVEFQRSTPPVS